MARRDTESQERAQVEELTKILDDSEKWAIDGPFVEQLEKLLAGLNVLSKLQHHDQPFAPVDSDLPWETRTKRLMAWLKSHPNFTCSDIEIVEDLSAGTSGSTTGAIRGVRATSSIAPGDFVLRLPLDTMISTETAQESKELGPLLDHPHLVTLQKMPTALFSAHVLIEHAKCLEAAPSSDVLSSVPVPATKLDGRTLQEMRADKLKSMQSAAAKGKKAEMSGTALDMASHPWGSRYRAFFSLLPSNVESIGNCLSWTIDDFKALAGTRAQQMGVKLVKDVAKVYCSFYTAFVEGGLVAGLENYWTWPHFRWVNALIMSRQNQMPGRSGEGQLELTLAPLYDMINHEKGPIASYFDPPTKAVELSAHRAFKAGDEVMMSYGGRANSELLVFQGFCVPDNIESERLSVPIEQGISADPAADPLAPMKIKLLSQDNLNITPYRHSQPYLIAKAVKLVNALGPRAPANMNIGMLPESERWSVPFAFDTGARPITEHDDHFHSDASSALEALIPRSLMSFCRVASLSKSDAATALRTLQQAKNDAAAKAAAEAAAKAAAKAARKAGGHSHSHSHSHDHGHGHSHGSHGHSHGDGEACGGHHDDDEEECDDDDEDDEDDDEDEGGHGHSHGGVACSGHGHGSHGGAPPPPIFLPAISEANEKAARALAASSVQAVIEKMQSGGAGSSSSAPSPASKFIDVYRSQHLAIAKAALKELQTPAVQH